MKALSIKQPWASLICTPREDNPLLGIKDIENRTWKTKHRGKIYVHVSAKAAGSMFKLLNPEQLKRVDDYLSKNDKQMDYSFSAIIGEVEIIDCIQDHSSIWAEHTIQNDSFETQKPTYNWILANPVLYEKPILNVKGKLSFWEPNINILKCIGCSHKFDAATMYQDQSEENFCTECWEELSPVMIQETKECEARDKLAEFGKVVTVSRSDHDFEFLITDGFSQKAMNTFACMEACSKIAEGYPNVKKCITEENKFHLVLTKEKK